MVGGSWERLQDNGKVLVCKLKKWGEFQTRGVEKREELGHAEGRRVAPESEVL